MRILDRSVYVGPSLYAHFPVIRLTLDLGELEEWPTERLGAAFVDRLLEALPGMHEHGCSYREAGGFVRRMREDEGTWMGHVFEHATLELQNMAGQNVTFGKTRGNGAYGQYDVVYQYEQKEAGLSAGRLALRLLHQLLPDELCADAREDDWDWEEERDSFIRASQRRMLGPSTASLVRAAEERDIPWMRLNEYSLVQLGHGVHQQRIQATVTSETKHIGVEIASDKEETNKLLGDLGLPVAKQKIVYSERHAVRAAESIGYPVVIKPLNANHGRGVTIHISDAETAKIAYENARLHSRAVLVERFIDGFDHRLLVVDGKLIAATRRVPGHVVGDGKRSIEALVDEVNADPRRGIGHSKVLTQLEFDYQANRLLEKKGYTQASVPAEGEVVYLRSTGNLSTGGTAVDVTDVVHPDIRSMAERAALAIGLDVCGVDFLTTDITESYKTTGGAICEVNAAPGFRMHVAPSEGTPRDVAGPVMDMLFPPSTASRIPIASITGTNGKTTTARMTAHIFKMTGKHVGLTTTDGVYIDGHPTVQGDMTGPTSAQMVLRDPKVEVAVLETARGGLLKRGMAYRRCNVGAVLNVQADHLGLRGVETLEDLARVKRIVAEIAQDTAVLNADDAQCLRMADHTRADYLCYVTMNQKHPLVRDHIRAGGRAVVLEQGMGGHMITIYDGDQHIPLLWSHMIPATLDGRALHNVQNAMFAAGIAYSMGVELEDIRHGLRTFDTTWFQAPGRMNIFDEHPFKVIMDYGHNPAAVSAMVDLVGRLEPKGRSLVLLAAPGDRRDQDVQEIARLCAGKFAHYYCRRDDSLRGREPNEVPEILAAALRDAGVADDAISIVPDEQEAVAAALGAARDGDLLLIFADSIARTWKQIQEFQPEGGSAAKTDDGLSTPSLPTGFGDFEDFGFDEDVQWIRDERGVRIADTEEAD